MLENARVAEELRLAFRSRAATLEAISDGVLSLDKRGKVTSINAVAARILGTTLAGNLKDLPDLAFLRLTLEQGEELDGRVTRVGTGEYLVNVRVIRSDTRDVVGAVVTLTEMKRAQQVAQRIVGSPARYSFGDLIGQAPSLAPPPAARRGGRALGLERAGHRRERHRQGGARAGDPQRLAARGAGRSSASTARRFRASCSRSELFGYEGGAFTGAKRAATPASSSWPRAAPSCSTRSATCRSRCRPSSCACLQEKRVHRIGGTREVELNARVIATTNRDLDERWSRRAASAATCSSASRSFTSSCRRCASAPATSRCWSSHFLGCSPRGSARTCARWRRTSMEAFMRYPWPGNIRELENVLEAEVNLATEEQTRARPSARRHPAAHDGRTGARRPRPWATAPRARSTQTEREMLVQALARNGWVDSRRRTPARHLARHRLQQAAPLPLDADQYRIK